MNYFAWFSFLFVFTLLLVTVITKPLKPLKIINLVLFSPSSEYDKMYKISKEFYQRFPNVDTVFYVFDPSLTCEYKFDPITQLLRVRGKESYVPGILRKTLKAFEFVHSRMKEGYHYDYVIRTNISTIVDFDILSIQLKQNPVSYAGGRKFKIVKGWRDLPGGIHDDRYEGIEFPFGTFILFSRHMFELIWKKISHINLTVIDDVSIGEFMQHYFPREKMHDFESLFVYLQSSNDIPELVKSRKYAIYRNRHVDRLTDIVCMEQLCLNLSKRIQHIKSR